MIFFGFAAAGTGVVPGAVAGAGVVVEVCAAGGGEDVVGELVEILVGVGVVEAFVEAVDEDSWVW